MTFNDIVYSFSDFFRNHYNKIITEEEIQQVEELVVSAQTDINFYLICEREQVAELWGRIRESNSRVNFVLKLLTDLELFIGDAFPPFRDRVAKAITQINVPYSMVDEELLERMTTTEEMKSIFKENPWIIVLFLFQYVNLVDFPSEQGNGKPDNSN